MFTKHNEQLQNLRRLRPEWTIHPDLKDAFCEETCSLLSHGFCSQCYNALALIVDTTNYCIQLHSHEAKNYNDVNFGRHLAERACEGLSHAYLISTDSPDLNDLFEEEEDSDDLLPGTVPCEREHLDEHVCPQADTAIGAPPADEHPAPEPERVITLHDLRAILTQILARATTQDYLIGVTSENFEDVIDDWIDLARELPLDHVSGTLTGLSDPEDQPETANDHELDDPVYPGLPPHALEDPTVLAGTFNTTCHVYLRMNQATFRNRRENRTFLRDFHDINIALAHHQVNDGPTDAQSSVNRLYRFSALMHRQEMLPQTGQPHEQCMFTPCLIGFLNLALTHARHPSTEIDNRTLLLLWIKTVIYGIVNTIGQASAYGSAFIDNLTPEAQEHFTALRDAGIELPEDEPDFFVTGSNEDEPQAYVPNALHLPNLRFDYDQE